MLLALLYSIFRLLLEGGLPPDRLERLRRLGDHVVRDMVRELTTRMRPALTGAVASPGPRRARAARSTSRTVARSLRTVRFREDGSPRLVPDRLVFRTRARRFAGLAVVLVVCVSGSMEAWVICRALDAAPGEWQNAKAMRDDIVAYMWRSGLVRQPVEAALPLIPRWERYLRSVGIDAVPRRPGQGPARAENLLNLLIRQGRKCATPASSTCFGT